MGLHGDQVPGAHGDAPRSVRSPEIMQLFAQACWCSPSQLRLETVRAGAARHKGRTRGAIVKFPPQGGAFYWIETKREKVDTQGIPDSLSFCPKTPPTLQHKDYTAWTASMPALLSELQTGCRVIRLPGWRSRACRNRSNLAKEPLARRWRFSSFAQARPVDRGKRGKSHHLPQELERPRLSNHWEKTPCR